MRKYYFAGKEYKLTRVKNGGQYSGPCPFIDAGKDRFIIEPDTGSWMCRECMSACTHGNRSSRGSFRFGRLSEVTERNSEWELPPIKEVKKTVTHSKDDYLEVAREFNRQLNTEVRAYLISRGLNGETIDRFRLGNYNGRGVTIPRLYHTKGNVLKCAAIKYRLLPRFERNGLPKYRGFRGHSTVGIFNPDAFRMESEFLIVANGLFDVMLLDQLGFPVIGSFAGEASWPAEWNKYIRSRVILNLKDNDDLNERTNTKPGDEYALSRAFKLSNCPNVVRVITAAPPDDIKDVCKMQELGLDITSWVNDLLKEYIDVDNRS